MTITKQRGKQSRLVGCLVASLFSTAALAEPVLFFAASPNPALVGKQAGVDVRISNVTDLFAYQFSVTFDSGLLRAGPASEGAFLAAGGSTIFDAGVVNNDLGTITMVLGSLTGPDLGVDGDGILAHIDFDVLRIGSGELRFTNATFLDSNLADLNVRAANTTLTAIPEPSSLALLALSLLGLAATRRPLAPSTEGQR